MKIQRTGDDVIDRMLLRLSQLEKKVERIETQRTPTVPAYDSEEPPSSSIHGQVALDLNGRLMSYSGSRGSWYTSMRSLPVIFDGITDPGAIVDVRIDFDCKIVRWSVLAHADGDITIDIWRSNYDNFPPTLADAITGTIKPSITADNKNYDEVLENWNVDLAAGDILRCIITSVTNINRATMVLQLKG